MLCMREDTMSSHSLAAGGVLIRGQPALATLVTSRRVARSTIASALVMVAALASWSCSEGEGLGGGLRAYKADAPDSEFNGLLQRFAGLSPFMQLPPDGHGELVLSETDRLKERHPVSRLQALGWDPASKHLYRMHVKMWYARWRGATGVGMLGVSVSMKPEDLDRLGPRLLFDYTSSKGQRVVAWSE